MFPAIIVPVKNREAYLDVFLDKFPKYLKNNGVEDFLIYVAEQVDDCMFNLPIARNVAIKEAMKDERHDYFIIHDVDIIPCKNVDYKIPEKDIVWFTNAGGCKILRKSMEIANGYNPVFCGWGYEEVEFWDRLSINQRYFHEWHRQPESKEAIMVNLEYPQLVDLQERAWSRGYFGYTDEGPRFVSYVNEEFGTKLEKQYDKSDFYSKKRCNDTNKRFCEFLFTLPAEYRKQYYQLRGMNLINLEKTTKRYLDEHGSLRLTYNSVNVMT
jgi:hypothetical protein